MSSSHTTASLTSALAGPTATGGGGAHSTANPDRAIYRVRNIEYPKHVWWFLACLIFVISICQLISRLHGLWSRSSRLRSQKSPSGDVESHTTPRTGAASLRRLPLALLNTYRVVAFRTTISLGSYSLNLAEAFLTCAYIIALFTWSFVNTTSISGERLLLRYWLNRTGTIAASQVPLVTVLGTKHNAIGWLVGVGYDKMNYLHRASARTLMIITWVHVGAHIRDGIEEDLPEAWLRWGIVAIGALSFLFIVSLRPIRQGAYELFFYIHFFCALLWILGAYFHTERFHLDTWVWPSFVFWGLDRLLRCIRLLFFNTHILSIHRSSHSREDRQLLKATPELISPEFVRLRVHRPPHMHWQPGQTAYLILPGVSRLPMEAHPFTIASVDDSAYPETALPGSDEKIAADRRSAYWKELVFFINVREGFTKRLGNAAREGKTVSVLVDAAYGDSPDLRGDDTVILVAGGSGVSFTLSHLLDVINQARAGKSVCKRVVFIWAIRDRRHIEWISDAVSKALEIVPSTLAVDIRIYITSASGPSLESQGGAGQSPVTSEKSSIDEKSEETDNIASLLAYSSVKVLSGRPDIRKELGEEVALSTGRLSVTVCGSQGLAQSVRSALRFGPSLVLTGGPSISLHVESYGYA